MSKRSNEPREIDLCDLCDGETVCLNLPDSRVLLSLEWHSQENDRQFGGESMIIDKSQVDISKLPSLERQKDSNSKRIDNLTKKYESHITPTDILFTERKKLKQALIHILTDVPEDTISIIRDSVLDEHSESRGFSEKPTQMAIDLVNYLYKYDRLKELTDYLARYHPRIKGLVDKEVDK